MITFVMVGLSIVSGLNAMCKLIQMMSVKKGTIVLEKKNCRLLDIFGGLLN